MTGPYNKSTKGHYVAYLFFKIFLDSVKKGSLFSFFLMIGGFLFIIVVHYH